MFRFLTFAFALAIMTAPAVAQQSSTQDKPFDVRSSVGDMHVGKDATAEKAGLPLYPGAQPKHDENNDPLNFGILTESFGLKLVVAKYESADPPTKVVTYYREKLKKYGTVLECHTHDDNDNVHSEDNDDQENSKELKCEGDNTGPATELKAGNRDNQHIVAVESRDNGKKSEFVIVYMHSQGKKGDI
jgi:hypothetical protein